MNNESSAIEDYIRQNRWTYTRQAIDGVLLTEGHDPEAIARAWASVEKRTTQPGQGYRMSSGAVVAAAILWLFYLGSLFLVVTFWDITWPSCIQLSWTGGCPPPVPRHIRTIDVLGVATQVVALIGAVVALRRGVRPWAPPVALIVMNLVWLFVIFGTCVNGGLP